MIWRLCRKGLSQTKIALNLGVSRQAIHKTRKEANVRVRKALLDAAQINKLDIKKVDSVKGVLVGYSHGFRSRVFLIFTPKNGVQLWYEHKGQCNDCEKRNECITKLLETAKEWEITLQEEDTMLPPTQLAERLFSEVAGKEGAIE